MFYVDCKFNFGVWCSFIVIAFVMTTFNTDGDGGSGGGGNGGVRGEITSKEHRTSASLQKGKELWCYHCNTMDSGERCEKLMDNKTDHHLKCRDEKMCMVKSISLTTSTGNSTSQPKLWLLERNCTRQCEPGCIVIGERTKLYACTKCCEADFCNAGRSSATTTRSSVHQLVICVYSLLLIFLH